MVSLPSVAFVIVGSLGVIVVVAPSFPPTTKDRAPSFVVSFSVIMSLRCGLHVALMSR